MPVVLVLRLLAAKALTVAGVSGVEPHNAGVASGVLNVAHQVGATLGLAVLVVVYAAGSKTAYSSAEMALHTGYAMYVAAVFLAASLLLAVRFLNFGFVLSHSRKPVRIN